MPRSLEEIMTRQSEFADAFERAEPTGKAVPREEIVARRKLRAAVREMSSAHGTLAEAVAAARMEHLSWKLIGDELGTSGEAARQRFARLVEDSEQFLIAGRDGRVVAGPAARARMNELAGLLVDCRSAFFVTANRFHWRPASESAAELVARALPSPDPNLASPRPETGHRLVTEAVATYLMTAAGHLGALGTMYSTGEVLFSPGMLVRATIECAARAMWILGDGQDRPESLLARAYLEEFLSAEEAKKAASRMGGRTNDVAIEHAQAWRNLRAEILDRFPGTTKEDLDEKDGRVLAGQRLLGPEAGTTWMWSLLERHAGSTVHEDAARGIYDYLSSATHPTLYPTRQLREWTERLDHPGEQMAQLRVEIDFLERQAVAAIVAYYNTLSYVTSFFGWSHEVHDNLTDRIDAVLPHVLKT